MNKRVMFGVVAIASLTGAPAWADDKADTAKMYAEWAAIPDGTVAPAVVNALAFETARGLDPTPKEVVYEMPAQIPSHDSSKSFEWTERAKLIPSAQNFFQLETYECNDSIGCLTDTFITDRTGLIVPYRKDRPLVQSGAGKPTYFFTKMSTLALTGLAAFPAITPPALPFTGYSYAEVVSGLFGSPITRLEHICSITAQNGGANVVCKTSGFNISDINHKLRRQDPSNDSSTYAWNNSFNMYLTSLGYGCFEDICDGHSHKVVDYKTEGDWHSKIVSAALSSADRQKALSLFSAGFNAYKSGDFVSAVALLQKGLGIDPENYLAYFTLAETARSAWINDHDNFWAGRVAFYNYQRTVDLGPDSPEGVRAQGRLDSGLQ